MSTYSSDPNLHLCELEGENEAGVMLARDGISPTLRLDIVLLGAVGDGDPVLPPVYLQPSEARDLGQHLVSMAASQAERHAQR